MYQKTRTGWTKHMDFLLLDITALFFACWTSFAIFTGEDFRGFYSSIRQIRIFILLSSMQVLFSILLNNLSNVLRRGYLKEFLSVFQLTIVLGAVYLASVFLEEKTVSPQFFSATGIFMGIDYMFRVALKHLIRRRRLKNPNRQRSLLIIAPQESAQRTIEKILRDNLEGYVIKGVIQTDDQQGCAEQICGIPVVGDLKSAASYVCREWVDEVLVLSSTQDEELQTFEKACAEMGVTLHTGTVFPHVNEDKQFVEMLGGRSVLTTVYNYVSGSQAFVKRLMDIVGGLLGSVIAILILLTIGPIIAVKSPGPVLFRQTRIGKNGKPFTLYKVRSMVTDAELQKEQLMQENRMEDERMFKLDFDPRIIGNRILPDGRKKTGIGEFIRKYSLDEFPQFFNVLMGDMSLVGTRPPLPEEWEKYSYHHRARLAMKPGITGMWQVNGRSDIKDFETVVRLDTEYICNFSIKLDIKILLKTIVILFNHKGAM